MIKVFASFLLLTAIDLTPQQIITQGCAAANTLQVKYPADQSILGLKILVCNGGKNIVPSLVGMKRTDATLLIERNGLLTITLFPVTNGLPDKGIVTVQSPVAGTVLAPGAYVTITVP